MNAASGLLLVFELLVVLFLCVVVYVGWLMD